MKKHLFILSIFLALALMLGMAYAGDDEDKPKEPKLQSICPKTLMDSSCLTCHSYPSFILKEISPESRYDYPVSGMRNIGDTVYYVIRGIDSDNVQAVFNYVEWHPPVKRIVLEIYSPGGSLFEGYKIVGLMKHMESKGYIIETRCYGFAASAGFLVMASGSKGHRFVSEIQEGMWHELITFEMFAVSGPSDKEDEARVLRHLQDTANNWLSSVSKLTKADIDLKIRKQEFWMNGKEAVEYGFADGFLK